MSRLNVRGLDPAGGVDGQVPVIAGGKFIIGTPPAPGSTVYKGRDRLVAAAADNTLTLGATPVAKSELVWVNGAIKWPSTDYTISGSVATFTAALAAGDVVAVVYDTTTTNPPASTLSHSTSVAIADTFTRANSTTSMGSTTTGAAPWTSYRGTWGIASNQAYLSNGNATSVNLAAVESGKADCTVQFTIANKSTGEQPGAFLRVTDANNGYILESGRNASATKTNLYKWVSGAATIIGQSSGTLELLAGDVIQVVMAGSSFTVKRNGAVIITATDSTFLTQTKHGFYLVSGGGSPAVRFDDFTVSA